MKYISLFLASFSVVMCIVLTYFLVFTELFIDRIDGNKRTILIVILVTYAIFRVIRIYQMFLKIRRNGSEN
ncbi:MAG: hypothetical protein V4622_12875 [Bacteroidota bacterium]